MKKTIIIFLAITLIIFLYPILYLKVNAKTTEEIKGTTYVELVRDSIDSNKINIIATDTTYNIIELKYVHKDIDLDNIDYFEQNNNDVYTFSISPSKEIQESFQLDGYGSYTVYAKNSRGDRFLSTLTLKSASDGPEINITKNADNPLHINIQVTSRSSGMVKTLKIAKREKFDTAIDFSKEGTVIEITPANSINIDYNEITEIGIYEIFAEDEHENQSISQIYLGSQSTTPIEVNISDGEEERQVKLEITDTVCDIIKIKVAKLSEISTSEDFKTKGESLDFTQGKSVNITYTAPEDNTYVFYVEDEAGYKKMVQKRITGEEKVIQVTVSQLDIQNKSDLTIYATNNICNITKIKVAIGENIDIDYFKNNGEELQITSGKTVTAKYTLEQDSVFNVYVEDEQGYSYMLTKNILGIDSQKPKEKPTIKLEQDNNDLNKINVTITGKDSNIEIIKWAEGSRDIEYFQDNGTIIASDKVGDVITTEISITTTGTYTVYAKDEAGNEAIAEINILGIDSQKPKEKPTIKLEQDNNDLNKINVTITGKDSNIETIKWAEGSRDIEYFQDNGTIIASDKVGDVITTEISIATTGTYTVYAKDEAGNEAIAEINISNIKEELQINSNTYEVDNENKMILKISPQTTKEAFDKLITINYSYKIIKQDGTELQSDEIIGTGMKLEILGDTNNYALVVKGDISGDGNVTIVDLVNATRHVIGLQELEGIYEKAGDVNSSGEITIIDILQIKRHIIGITEL